MSSQLGQIFVLLEQIEAGTLALPPTPHPHHAHLGWSATRASHFIRYVSYLSVPPPPLPHPISGSSFLFSLSLILCHVAQLCLRGTC